jgi:DNA-binding CsgD family transcriptional regulator
MQYSMDKRFIIIHPFELVRKGLWAILRETFHHEFILLPGVESLKDYSGLQQLHLLIFLSESLRTSENETFINHLLGAENKVQYLTINHSAQNLTADSIAIEQAATLITDTVKCQLDKLKPQNNQLTDLSEREKDVLQLVALGHSNKEIAEKLFISIHTVISHRKNITEKLGIKSISGLTVYAILNKMIDTEHIDPTSLI